MTKKAVSLSRISQALVRCNVMTLEDHINNVKALIDYRNTATDPIEGVEILLKCAKEFNDIDLKPLSNELQQNGPKQFIEDNLPDPFGIENDLTEPFSFSKLLADKAFREKFYASQRGFNLSDEDIMKISSSFTPRFSLHDEGETFVEYLYSKLEDFWRNKSDEQLIIKQPTKGVLEDYLAEECGIEYRTLINSGIVLSTFQDILKCKNRQEKLVLIKNNSPSLNSTPRKDRCLAFIIGLGDWGKKVHDGLKKFGYSLVNTFDHELTIKYLLTQPSDKSGRENLEWINDVLKSVLSSESYQKYHFAMPGDRVQKKQNEQTNSEKS